MRQPKPFYRKQTDSWYVQLGKKQTPLIDGHGEPIRGKENKKAAYNAYYKIMADRQPVTDSSSVAAVLKKFLAWNETHRSPGSQEFYGYYVVSFAEHIGDRLTVDQLKPLHVSEWVDKDFGKLSSTTRRNAIRAVQRALNWAVDEGHLQNSPIKRIKKPAARSRDAILEPEQWAIVAGALPPDALEFATVLRLTGCRPQEARAVEARHLDRKDKSIVFESCESKGSSDATEVERRVVPLNAEVFGLLSKLALRYPDGPMIRNSFGTPWTTRAVGKAFERASKKTGIEVSAYVLRHTFITDMLVAGTDPIALATLVGHKSLTQIMRTYQHLKKKGAFLRKVLEDGLAAAYGTPVNRSA